MIDATGFRTWLVESTGRKPVSAKDITSRMKRADKLLPWDASDTYCYRILQLPELKDLSISSKSQIKGAAILYAKYCAEK